MRPQVAIAITADDKTAKGWASAEKRAGKSLGKIGGGKDALKATQDGIGRNSKGIVKSLSAIEQAGSRVLSGGGIIGKAGAIRDIGLLARGFGAAAAEGIGLEGAAIGVTGAVTGIAGAAVVAGAAMWKLADGWGKGANQLGNMASLIGVSTAGLQKFAGAAERVGVDKDTATGALGSLSQTLNDARYGRNNGALAILGKMGVKLQTNQDGTVNVEAMLPAIATALAAQNSSGRRTAGHALGISDAAMAAFTQGGANLSADMDDYGKNGGMISDADTKLGRKLTHRDVSGMQRLGKTWLGLQRWNAGNVDGVGDAAIGAAGRISKLSPPSLIGSAAAQEMPDAGPFSKSMDMASEADVRRSDRVWRTPPPKPSDMSAAIEAAGARLSHNARVHRNPGNVRPTTGHGFVTYPTYQAGIAAMAGQIRRDQTKHGARTVTDVIAGAVGRDGKRHWGYAPPEDHNDTPAYIRHVAQTMGVKPNQAINLSDPETLSRETYGHIKQENGHEVFSLDQIRAVVAAMHIENHITVEDRRVTAKSSTGRARGSRPAISHAMLP